MKNKLIELIDALYEELTPNAYIKITNAIQSLPDDQPDLLPFEYPVKEGLRGCYKGRTEGGAVDQV